MANVDAACGLRPVKVLGGGSPQPSGGYSIASGYAANIFFGMPVEMTGTGTNIQQAAAGNVDNIGVFAGVAYTNAQGKRVFSKFWPASTVATDVEAFVYDDPNIIYEAQCDALAEADVGLLTDWDGVTGSTTTGMSTAELAASSGATTGQSLRILRLVDRPDNAYGNYAKAEVVFVEHALHTGAAGAGGV